MKISELANNNFDALIQQQPTKTTDAKSGNEATFSSTLGGLMEEVNNLQLDSKDMTERFIKGEPVDLHDVMISAEKAKTGFQLLMEMRNKFLDLYKEVSRMQV